MIAGADPLPWQLVHGGVIVRVARDGADAIVSIEAPHLAPAIRFRLVGCSPLTLWPYDGEPIDEPAACRLEIVEARADSDRMIVWGTEGSLRFRCARLAVESPGSLTALRDAARAYWATRTLDAHPAIQALLAGSLDGAVPRLIELWRRERTSELGLAVAIADARTHGAAPARLDGPETVEAWCATWTREPGAALAELVRRIQAAGWDPSWHYDDASMNARARIWAMFTRCLAALAGAAPDPRIARAVERALDVSGGSDNWFRADQVAHVVMAFSKTSDEPSFADHALALLADHADGGSATRLERFVEKLRHEAACNEAEMAERLTALAATLRARYPTDQPMSDELAAALWSR